MMDYILMWLLVVAENAKAVLAGSWVTFFAFVGAILILAGCIYAFIRIMSVGDVTSSGRSSWSEKEEEIYKSVQPRLKRWGVGLLVLAFFMSLLAAVTPTMKQAAVIYIVPKVLNNPNVQELPNNVLMLFNEGLKELTDLLKDETAEALNGAKDAAKIGAGEAAKVIRDTRSAVEEGATAMKEKAAEEANEVIDAAANAAKKKLAEAQ